MTINGEILRLNHVYQHVQYKLDRIKYGFLSARFVLTKLNIILTKMNKTGSSLL